MKKTSIDLSKKTEDNLLQIADLEKKSIDDILEDALKEYIERYKESFELLENPEFNKAIKIGKEEALNKVKGKSLNELDN